MAAKRILICLLLSLISNCVFSKSPIQYRDTITDNRLIIPVFIHIIYHREEENISDDKIISQIAELNQDFNAWNKDIELLPDTFKKLVGTANILFSLEGYSRVCTILPFFFYYEGMKIQPIKCSDCGGEDAYEPDHVLNIWVCKLSGLYGYSQFPSEGIFENDGVVIDYRSFGKDSSSSKVVFGRVATHEIGHWLGLRHIWGDDEVGETDLCSDTPKQLCPSFGNPVFPYYDDYACEYPGRMFYNYMDYSDEKTVRMFTKEQVNIMWSTLLIMRKKFLQNY